MKILAVDDERPALSELEDAIAAAAPESDIYSCMDVESAIAIMEKQICDVAFLDIHLPELSGVDAARKLKEIYPKVNIIFVTAYGEYTGDAMSMHASGYIMKPVTENSVRMEMEDLRFLPVSGQNQNAAIATATEERDYSDGSEDLPKLSIRAFGDFEVFIDHKPLPFQYNKTKELLAYLVDRRGAVCSNAQIMGALWEDDEDERGHISYMKKLRTDLIVSLTKAGCGDVILRRRGAIGVAKEKIDCDYFDWCDGKQDSFDRYHGEYMSQYSWGEYTHGMLDEVFYSRMSK
ncbi:response regulator [Brotaphodocola sp.]|uniref:response regulator n=1 Tax=Brotaphodocola sp. TaxID=3073577 RepID=UPI003D7E7203